MKNCRNFAPESICSCCKG